MRDQGLTVQFCTNTDSVTPTGLADRLAERGFEAPRTSWSPRWRWRPGCSPPRRRRKCWLAADGVRELLGRSLAGPGEPASHVLVADPNYGATYDDLDAAFRALRADAELVATSQPGRGPRRRRALDTGGWVRLLEYAAGRTARVLGKPSPEFFTAPLDALGRGRTRPWSSATTWPPTSAGAGPWARPRCWSAAARATALAGADAEPDAVVDSVADLPGLLGG